MGPRTKSVAHYEAAFEDWLRRRGLPYIAVDEAKKALFAGAKLKSFDFVVYRPEGKNLLVDVKGRVCGISGDGKPRGTLQNWTTREDIDDLREWQTIFGDGFIAMFLFMYHWPGKPELSPFKENFCFQGRWYSMMGLSVADYRSVMKSRSESWGTVSVPAKEFKRLAKPFEEWL